MHGAIAESGIQSRILHRIIKISKPLMCRHCEERSDVAISN